MIGLIKNQGGFTYIKKLMEYKLPLKLVIELLKPYVYNLHARKVNINDFTSQLFPVLVIIKIECSIMCREIKSW